MKCPACGYLSELTMNVQSGENYKAQPYDVGICLRCGVKQAIDQNGELILLSKEMEDALPFWMKQILKQIVEQWYETQVRAS
jgi:hypothetical protein